MPGVSSPARRLRSFPADVVRSNSRPAGRRNLMSSLWNRRSVAALLLLGGLAACDEPVPFRRPMAAAVAALPGDPRPPRPRPTHSPRPMAFRYTGDHRASRSTPPPLPSPPSPSRDRSQTAPTRRDASWSWAETTLQATASLIPGTKYRATISTRIAQSTNGGSLPRPTPGPSRLGRSFTFARSTTGAHGYFGHLALAEDSSGGLHAVYADSVNGDFFYAECASSCAPARPAGAPR